MAKLNKEQAKAAAESESTSFDPIPDGPYQVQLRDVEVKQGAEYPYWLWSFEVAEGEHLGRRVWLNTSTSPKALWKLHEAMVAFGVKDDTDTEDLIGKTVTATIEITTIQSGAKQGQETNSIVLLSEAKGTTAKGKGKDRPRF